MNKDFVTEGLRDDRCLKAYRLVNRFETEIRAEIKRTGKEIVESNPGLIDSEPGSNFKASWDSGTIIANFRDNLRMNRVNADTPSNRLKLNLSVRWVDPIDWGERDVEGALCAACYKINNGAKGDFQRVKDETVTGEWNIRIGDDQFSNAPAIFYIPIESGEDLQTASQTIQQHFTEYGDYWGVPPSEVNANG